ncbi:hypothetical protein DPEC_G00231120 [Dallia pectoralis]|uniref:Uncharacterized protein n=1 Tax=Dallia pectoralis TaxID=75939 RepID=A0ACC2FWY9_DALPE|nr:hypothetical protein DPEC_G00231120 [Dallia pectoralis]
MEDETMGLEDSGDEGSGSQCSYRRADGLKQSVSGDRVLTEPHDGSRMNSLHLPPPPSPPPTAAHNGSRINPASSTMGTHATGSFMPMLLTL